MASVEATAEKHRIADELVDSLNVLGQELTALETAIDDFDDDRTSVLRKQLNTVLEKMAVAREKATKTVGQGVMAPERMAIALGTYGAAEDVSGPMHYVRSELLRLDELASKKDAQRNKADSLRTALLEHQQGAS